jgi:hypothetical protein
MRGSPHFDGFSIMAGLLIIIVVESKRHGGMSESLNHHVAHDNLKSNASGSHFSPNRTKPTTR